MRKPVFSGKLYNQGFDELTKQLEKLFEQGPGDLPVSLRNKEIKGLIVPHTNYILSGNVSAWAYKELGESKFPEIFILLGDAQFGKGENKAYLSLRDFETPLGVVKNIGLKATEDFIEVNEDIHDKESCIELQLPFLQFVSKDKLDKLKIMPILFDKCDYSSLMKIAKMIKNLKKNYIVIASSNLTMYGDKFGFVPFKYNIKEEVKGIDSMIRDSILKLKTNEFLELASKFNVSGSQSITILFEVLKDDCKARELMYGNSGEITNDYDNFVTFSSVIFENL